MPSSTIYSANLTASTKTANIFAGDVNEFVPYDAQVTVYSVSSAIGVRLTAMADSDVAVDDKEISAIGTSLNKSDHMLDSFTVGAGTRIAIFLREVAAAATTDVYVCLEIDPL